MGSVFNLLTKRMARTFDNVLSELNKAADELSHTTFDEEFEKLSKSVEKKFDSLKDILLNKNDKYVMEIAYDRDKQTMQTKIENGLMTVIVEEKNENDELVSQSTTTITIPSDVCLDKLNQAYDKERKIMVFSLNKKPNEKKVDETETKVQETEVKSETPKEEVKEQDKKTELIKMMLEMYQNGSTFKAIAEKVGLSDKTVAKYIRRFTQNEATKA